MSAVLKDRPFSYRPMIDADLPAIARIERQSYFAPWSEMTFADCLRVGYCCWTQQCGDGIGGYGIMTVAAGEAHILNVCVREDLRGQGYGRSLMLHLMTLARRHNAVDIFLEVRPSNSAAMHLYERLGFRSIGVRRDYYPAPHGRENALVLNRRLLTAASL